MKIHTALISWIVNLLLPVRNVPDNATDQFQNLSRDVRVDLFPGAFFQRIIYLSSLLVDHVQDKLATGWCGH